MGEWLLAPLALASLATGAGLALLTRWSPLRYGWVAAKLTITSVMAAAVFAVLLPSLDRAAGTAIAATGRHLTDAERIPLAAAPAAAVGLLTLNVVLGIYHPGGRGPRRPPGIGVSIRRRMAARTE